VAVSNHSGEGQITHSSVRVRTWCMCVCVCGTGGSAPSPLDKTTRHDASANRRRPYNSGSAAAASASQASFERTLLMKLDIADDDYDDDGGWRAGLNAVDFTMWRGGVRLQRRRRMASSR